MGVTSAISNLLSDNEAARRRARFVGGICLLTMALQTLGYLLLGTSGTGRSFSGFITLFQYLIAIASAWFAYRRARGIACLFWLLFLATDCVLMVPSVLQMVADFSQRALVSDATWRALYLLYGAPVLMMMVLPDCDDDGRIPAEIFVDLLQVTMVVGLAFSILFYVPLQQMLPRNALEHNLTVSNLVSLLLLFAIFLRLRMAHLPAARDRLLRLGAFLFTCAVVTFIGNWIDQHHYAVVSAWWDLGWDLPIFAATVGAVTARDYPEAQIRARNPGLMAFFAKNLGLVVVLFAVKLIVDQWSPPPGTVLTNAAVVASLVVFTVRLALTQHRQQQEIARRKAAQNDLTKANNRIGALLDEAHQQTAEIKQVNELVSLLQACTSAKAAYNLVSECLQGLLPACSGCLTRVTPGKDSVEWIAQWGQNPPSASEFKPSNCSALQRGSSHVLSSVSPALRCHHLAGGGPSICTPITANGIVVGTLAMQAPEAQQTSGGAERSATSERFKRECDLIVAVSRHLSLALSNLEMREELRLQAIRDPLTGLYNRRYMQEFLDRETTRASRQKRAVSVLVLDLDHFKLFNDNFGHAAGDYALRAVGEFLLHRIRSDDVACRYGGEEFVIILPECSLEQATTRAEQIRGGLAERGFEYQGVEHTVTVSIGVAAFEETTDRVHGLIACADEALYEAKRGGRNRVVAARPVTAMNQVQADEVRTGS